MKVIVVGAGISGLYCADKLTGAKKSCLVLEQSNRIGGRMSTYQFKLNNHDYLYEAGGLRINQSHKYMLSLLKRLHLDQFLVPKTVCCMIIDKPNSLHMGINGCGSNESKSAFF